MLKKVRTPTTMKRKMWKTTHTTQTIKSDKKVAKDEKNSPQKAMMITLKAP